MVSTTNYFLTQAEQWKGTVRWFGFWNGSQNEGENKKKGNSKSIEKGGKKNEAMSWREIKTQGTLRE